MRLIQKQNDIMTYWCLRTRNSNYAAMSNLTLLASLDGDAMQSRWLANSIEKDPTLW
jgi:hypothetical protein